MNVLIVDDLQDNLDMLNIILKSKGYDVKTAKNGKQALEVLHSNTVDLIVSDILMPVMDGFQFCKACKLDASLKKIPFIFYTATYIDKKDEELALSMGADRFLVKPQEPHVILAVVEQVMNEKNNHVKEQDMKINVPDEEVYKLYSERLINKLEKKMQDLEKEIAFRKKIESELIIAKENAEQSDKLKSAFLANISHEIRTPLNGIIGFSSLLKELKPDTDQANKFVDIIIRSGQRLTSIIADIIEISKLETGQVTVALDEVKVKVLLDSIYDEMLISLPGHGQVKLLAAYDAIDDSLIIQADRTKLAQILTNLVSNAIKYTPAGTITIGAAISDQDTIEFFVEDTGIGISKDFHHLIFERFRQVHEPASIFQSGTGLGLAISKSYVELLGGRIGLSSEPGKGSRFMFSIPIKPFDGEAGEAVETLNIHACNLAGKYILLVEDDEDNYQFMAESLKTVHAYILWAKDGESAVTFVRDNPHIDLVLMDIRMPVMNGLDATREILKIRPGLPVVAQTAYAYSDDKTRALAAGCVDIITKPFTISDFVLVICRNID